MTWNKEREREREREREGIVWKAACNSDKRGERKRE
jgi:hypothetical protein